MTLVLKVLGHITSCTRPLVWLHLQVNRSSERGLCLLIAWWRTFLLPPAHGKIEDKGTERQPSHQPLVHTGRLTCLSMQQGLCAQSLAKETGEPLRCLAYPNSYRSYLVYSRPARWTAHPTVGQSNHSKTTCSNLDYDITATGIKIQTSTWPWPTTFKLEFSHLAVHVPPRYLLDCYLLLYINAAF